MKENVALICSRIQTGGISTSVITLRERLLKQGKNVYVITHECQGNLHNTISTNFKIIERKDFELFRQYLKDNCITTIIFNSIMYDLKIEHLKICEELKIKTIGILRNSVLSPKVDGVKKFRMNYKSFRKFNQILTLNELDTFYLKQLGYKAMTILDETKLLPNTIKNSEKRDKDNSINLITTMVIQNIKQPNALVEIVKELEIYKKEVKLRIVGPVFKTNNKSKFDIEAFKQLIEENGLTKKIEFCGEKNSQEMSQLYNSSDIYVCTSLLETHGHTIIEAMSQGLPVTMFNLDWIWAAGRNKGCVQIPMNNYKIFAKKIYEIYKNDELKKRMSKLNLLKISKYKKFNFDKMWKKVLNNKKVRVPGFNKNVDTKYLINKINIYENYLYKNFIK